MTRSLIGLSGNLERPSKTRALVQTIVATAADRFEAAGRSMIWRISAPRSAPRGGLRTWPRRHAPRWR
ncbi:hypothetical protein ACFSHQ_25260 [Gemmobacter lanyuensis]